MTNLFTRRRVLGSGLVVLITALALVGCTATGAPEATPSTTSDGSQQTTPMPSTTVSPPTSGTIADVEPSPSPAPTTSAKLTDPIKLNTGMTITVEKVSHVDFTAETPGELAGPGIALTLKAHNGSNKAVDLSTAMVSLTLADGTLGQPTTSEPYAPILTSVAPGKDATGVYTFRLPSDDRAALSVTVEYLAGAPIALFVGDSE